jgi:hypothetical protein
MLITWHRRGEYCANCASSMSNFLQLFFFDRSCTHPFHTNFLNSLPLHGAHRLGRNHGWVHNWSNWDGGYGQDVCPEAQCCRMEVRFLRNSTSTEPFISWYVTDTFFLPTTASFQDDKSAFGSSIVFGRLDYHSGTKLAADSHC